VTSPQRRTPRQPLHAEPASTTSLGNARGAAGNSAYSRLASPMGSYDAAGGGSEGDVGDLLRWAGGLGDGRDAFSEWGFKTPNSTPAVRH
jgi:hypothetical protein